MYLILKCLSKANCIIYNIIQYINTDLIGQKPRNLFNFNFFINFTDFTIPISFS